MAIVPKANRDVTLVVERDGQRSRQSRSRPTAVGKYEIGDIGVAADPASADRRPSIPASRPSEAGLQAGRRRSSRVDGERDVTHERLIELITGARRTSR